MAKQSSEVVKTAVENKSKVRVWDIYIRIFHWFLLLSVVIAFISVKIDRMDIHFIAGHCVLALLIFRILWGFWGSGTALFRTFIRGPRTILAYVRGSAPHQFQGMIGHNPLGALSVVALIVVIAFQVITGLMADDEILWQGPLVKYVSAELVEQATRYHHLNEKIIIALIIMHIVAIIYYWFVKKDNLILPMILGYKWISSDQAKHVKPILNSRFGVALVIIIVSLMGAYFLYHA